ncbi:MAG TPA: hypothetical protein ENK19_10730, partial [Acidobacteria bacterium]|nr:hypothetical protein [Acidobacteriota bacterium]
MGRRRPAPALPEVIPSERSEPRDLTMGSTRSSPRSRLIPRRLPFCLVGKTTPTWCCPPEAPCSLLFQPGCTGGFRRETAETAVSVTFLPAPPPRRTPCTPQAPPPGETIAVVSGVPAHTAPSAVLPGGQNHPHVVLTLWNTVLFALPARVHRRVPSRDRGDGCQCGVSPGAAAEAYSLYAAGAGAGRNVAMAAVSAVAAGTRRCTRAAVQSPVMKRWILSCAFVVLTLSSLAQAAPRVVILGFDGADSKLTEKWMAQGELPHLAALAKAGGYARLNPTIPAQTPVSWSTFTTGRDPGGTRIFDFLVRDPETYMPSFGVAKEESRQFLWGPHNGAVLLAAGAVVGWLLF